MKKAIPFWQMAGFIFTAAVGTLLHFLLNWAGGNVVAALFSAVNESIWEHMKLLFYPQVLFALAEYIFWGKDVEAFWYIKLTGIVIGLALIPVAYYTYTGILGIDADWFNIAIFFLAAGVAYWRETVLFQRNALCSIHPKLSVVLLCLLAAVFILFTFTPPCIPLFRDPMTGGYGY